MLPLRGSRNTLAARLNLFPSLQSTSGLADRRVLEYVHSKIVAAS